MTFKRFYSHALTVGSIVLGNALLAFLVAAFVIPHDIIMGGATGIGLILTRFLPFETSTLVLILNLLLLAFGAMTLGKKFFLTTVASSVLYPLFLSVFENVPGISGLTDNILLASLFGGALLGIALGLVMRVGSSTGGTDVLNLVMHKWMHIPISVCVYIVDVIVLGGQAFFSSANGILYGILFLVIETLVLDKMMLLGQSQIQILVFSGRYEEIRSRLLSEQDVGVTMMMTETGYTRQEQKGVLCVISPRKLYACKELILSIDPVAFMTITQIKEVRGRGFTLD